MRVLLGEVKTFFLPRAFPMQPPSRVLNIYEFQRFVFDQAVDLGWRGRQPLLLGDAEADQAFQDAFGFLKVLGTSN